ncbi:hypothetical protein C8Q80DRAFT_1064644, partial [Daedaleopsis nitida]
MLLIDLADDVLRLICDCLIPQDALNLSLVSKRLHALATYRILAVFIASKPKTLRAFHRYVLDPDAPPRAQYIESIEIKPHILYNVDESDGDSHGARSGYLGNAMPVLLQLFADLLQNANNLRRLVL